MFSPARHEPKLVVSPFTPRDVRRLPRRAAASIFDTLLLGLAAWLVFQTTVHSWRGTLPAPNGRIWNVTYVSGHEMLAYLGITLVMLLGYFISLEWVFGWTLGKLLFKLRVVDFNGGSISFGQAVVRTLCRLVDHLPFGLYLIGGLVAAASPRRQRWGDRGAGTLVVSAWAAGAVYRGPNAGVPIPATTFLASRQV